MRSSMYIDRHTHTLSHTQKPGMVSEKKMCIKNRYTLARDWLCIAVMKGVGHGGSSLRGILRGILRAC